MKADLHLHSTASDGTLAPNELVVLAAELGFTHLALTDHDSVEGIQAAYDAAQDCGIELITGVELSCGAQKEIHILGYGFDPCDEQMVEFCRMRTLERRGRAAKMVRQLGENGVDISLNIFALAEDGLYERMEESFREIAATQAEFTAMLEKAGFELLEVREYLTDREPAEDSDKLMFCARKK